MFNSKQVTLLSALSLGIIVPQVTADPATKYAISFPEHSRLVNVTDTSKTYDGPGPVEFDTWGLPLLNQPFTWIRLNPDNHDEQFWSVNVNASAGYSWTGQSKWTLSYDTPFAKADDDKAGSAGFKIIGDSFKCLKEPCNDAKPSYDSDQN